MNQKKTLTVSLISHNSQTDLKLLIPSIYYAIRDIDYEILLVDNCSTDGTIEFIETTYPEIIISKNDTVSFNINLGKRDVTRTADSS